jgi:hypothetical protein
MQVNLYQSKTKIDLQVKTLKRKNTLVKKEKPNLPHEENESLIIHKEPGDKQVLKNKLANKL